MDQKTLNEWHEYYFKHTGKRVKEKPFATLLFEESNGFMYFAINHDECCLLIFETAGDGKHWEEKAMNICRTNNLKEMFTTIYISPEVYLRRYKGEVFGTIIRKGVDEHGS